MNNSLDEFRKQIDLIDQELVDSITKRVEVVKKVSKFKKEHNLPPLDRSRWNAVLEKVRTLSTQKGIDPELTTDIYERIHRHSLELEGSQKVYYLGPEGSYSHNIAMKMFPEDRYILIPFESFNEIRNAVIAGEVIGILPIENSITSNIHENVDALYSGKFKIIGEGYLDIKLDLIGIEGTTSETIQTVYSHPKALDQCSQIIESNSFRQIQTQSTSEAIRKVLALKSNKEAAIGDGEYATELGLKVVAADVGNEKNNQTRFIAIKKHDSINDLSENAGKLSLIVNVKHEVGALAQLLRLISEADGNLTKIESRPIPGSNWKYSFLLDIEGLDFQKIVETISPAIEEYTVLGNYKLLTA